MRRTLLHSALTFFLLLLPTVAMGYDFMVDSIYYNVRNGQAIVTNKGSENGHSSDVVLPDSYSGEVTVPRTVTHDGITYSVTAVGDYAFKSCPGMTNITLPKSILTIGKSAFAHCSGLTTLTLPNSVTSIGEYAFYKCSHLTSITFGSGVTSIGDLIFDHCNQITDITCLALIPPAIAGYSLFNEYSMYYHAKLHVLPECVETYESTTSSCWGEFFQIIGDAVIEIPGDVNGDGEVNIGDTNSVVVIIINGGSQGHTRPDGKNEAEFADINDDGEINIADLNAIIDMILSH